MRGSHRDLTTNMTVGIAMMMMMTYDVVFILGDTTTVPSINQSKHTKSMTGGVGYRRKFGSRRCRVFELEKYKKSSSSGHGQSVAAETGIW
jgi:hypothetical protein